MGSLSTLFLAAVIATLRCTELLLSKNVMRKRVFVCCDSRAAIAMPAKTTDILTLVWECMQVLGQLIVPIVTVVWILGHDGVLGNEKVDKLVKERISKVPVDQTTSIPFGVGKEVIRSH